MILTGSKAKETLESILDKYDQDEGDYPEPYVAGWFKEDDTYIAFDNQDKCCWVEEFRTRQAAVRWIQTSLMPK